MSKPNIATKNLSGITELLIAENIQFKKCLSYANQVQDADLKTIIGDMAQCHKDRYDELYQYLNGHQ
jgi:hypothetical protein